MKTKMLGLFALAGMLLATSCSNDTADPYLSNNDLVDVSFSIGLERGLGMRATTDGDGSGKTTRISDGTRATDLFFALCDKDGNLIQFTPTQNGNPISNKNTEDLPKNVYKVSVKDLDMIISDDETKDKGFTFKCELVKGLEYTLVFWAQSEDADKYYDLSNFPTVNINYDGEDNHNNNDEMRDAFCKSHTFVVPSMATATAQTLILTRPFAQINVGVESDAWDEYEGNQIKTSSITIKNAVNSFDILKNKAVTGENALCSVEYTEAIIPADITSLSDVSISDDNRKLFVDINKNGTIEATEKFYWISMCYILVPDDNDSDSENTYTTTLESLSFKAFKEDKNEARAFVIPENAMTNVPVKRNYRTNIIITKKAIEEKYANVDLTIELDRGYNEDDYNGPEFK